MVRLNAVMAMNKFSKTTGTVASVGDVFGPSNQWLPELKEANNEYASEFRLVNVPPDVGADVECGSVPDDESGKNSKEKYYGTAFKEKQGGNRMMSLLWAQEGGYWKIIAIRLEDNSDSGIVPKKTSVSASSEEEPKPIAGDPVAVKNITDFYQVWIVKRDSAQASKFVSQRSLACLQAPSPAEKNLAPATRVRSAMNRVLEKMPQGTHLSELMSSVQPVNELLRPLVQENSKAFAIMAVPDQKADSFLCQNRHVPEKTPELTPSDAKYGTYYLSASRMNFGEEQSSALLLLWSKENAGWKVIAWAIEVP